MDKIKEFIEQHKMEVACVVCTYLTYKIAYRRGFKDYSKVVNNVFNSMRKNGYNVVQLIEPGVKG